MWDAFLPSILTSYLPTWNGFSKTLLFLKIQMSPFFPPIPTGKTGNARCEMSLFAPPLNTYILTELSSLLVLSGEPPCHLSAGSRLFSHTQMHSRDQFLTEDGLPSSVPSWVMNKEQFSQARSAQLEKDFKTKRKWAYWEESAKEPWKEKLRCWCLCRYIKML